MNQDIKYALEGLGLNLIYFIFWLLPLDMASNIGGWLGRMIGPRIGATKHARNHLTLAFPDMKDEKVEKTILEMWDNLGRVIAEYPHLETISRERTDLKGKTMLKKLFKSGGPAIFFGAHLSNWEISSPTLLTQMGEKVDVTYRAPNNPWADKLLGYARTLGHQIKAYPKSKTGGRQMMEALQNDRFVGFLIDQKYNEGIPASFFNQPAMTNPVFVKLCQKYKCPLIPFHGQRLNGCNFKLTFGEPIKLFDSRNKPLPVEKVIENAHTHLEDWIKKNPAQWLWLHKRWNSKRLAKS